MSNHNIDKQKGIIMPNETLNSKNNHRKILDYVWIGAFLEVLVCLTKQEDYMKLKKPLTPEKARKLAGKMSDAFEGDCILSILGQLYPYQQISGNEDDFFSELYIEFGTWIAAVLKDLPLPNPKAFGIGTSTGEFFKHMEVPSPKFSDELKSLKPHKGVITIGEFVMPVILFAVDDQTLDKAFDDILSFSLDNIRVNKFWNLTKDSKLTLNFYWQGSGSQYSIFSEAFKDSLRKDLEKEGITLVT